MATRLIVLKNRHLTVKFDPDTGELVHLSRSGRGKGLIAGAPVRYLVTAQGRAVEWHSTEVGGVLDAKPIGPPAIDAGDDWLAATYAAEHLHLKVRYSLPDDSALLHVTSAVRGSGRQGLLQYLWAPRLQFTEGFNNQFEDPEDLYDDGAEVGRGVELPCWRVFFRKGHRDGLILATRSKADMSHFNIVADAFDVQPQAALNYSTATLGRERPVNGASRRVYTASFEIGPWSRERHSAILRSARLKQPVKVAHPPVRGKPSASLRGELFHAAAFAPSSATSDAYSAKRWQVVKVPWSQSGQALFASTGVKPPAISLDPQLEGLYHVYVGVGNGEGVTVRATGDPETRIRISRSRSGHGNVSVWQLRLSGRHRPSEVDVGIIRLDGRKLRLGRFPDLQRPCMIDYVRCEKLSDREVTRWRRQEQAEPILPLSGLTDCPDIATLLDAGDPDPRAFAAVVWEHSNSKVKNIYWRIDGQCSDFPSRTNTMRYVSAKVHGVFTPHSKAYGRALQKADILRIAVDAGRRYGVGIWGWMRFNNYSGNVQSDFFKNNPKYHEKWEGGGAAAKLCIAHRAVRRHKIDILIEAAKYGLEGLNLGFLRHPPILLYADVMCRAYERKYGHPPPRDLDHPDQRHATTLPQRKDQPAYERWWLFRAGYLTTFARELKAALSENDLAHVKIAIWVRPNHCLFDGIDLPTWLDEGLCDEVVTMHYNSNVDDRELNWERPEWKRMVQARVPLIRTILPWTDGALVRKETERILAEGYDGICSYESNDTVLDTRFIKLFRSLRK